MDKKMLRRENKGKLEALSAEQIEQKSGLICEHFVASEQFEVAEVVMVYLAMANEADLTGIILEARHRRKRVVVPKVLPLEREMIAVEIDSLQTGIEAGAYGIDEPVSDKAIDVAEIDIIIVPGLGFDAMGGRLGRGGGYYDRFLCPPAIKATLFGCGFVEQVVESVPMETHDRYMDYLLTDEGIIDCKQVHGG